MSAKETKEFLYLSNNELARKKSDVEKEKRIQRLLQVRQQESENASRLRKDFKISVQKLKHDVVQQAKQSWVAEKNQQLSQLEEQLKRHHSQIGRAHVGAKSEAEALAKEEVTAKIDALKQRDIENMRYQSAYEERLQEIEASRKEIQEYVKRRERIMAVENERSAKASMIGHKIRERLQLEESKAAAERLNATEYSKSIGWYGVSGSTRGYEQTFHHRVPSANIVSKYRSVSPTHVNKFEPSAMDTSAMDQADERLLYEKKKDTAEELEIQEHARTVQERYQRALNSLQLQKEIERLHHDLDLEQDRRKRDNLAQLDAERRMIIDRSLEQKPANPSRSIIEDQFEHEFRQIIDELPSPCPQPWAVKVHLPEGLYDKQCPKSTPKTHLDGQDESAQNKVHFSSQSVLAARTGVGKVDQYPQRKQTSVDKIDSDLPYGQDPESIEQQLFESEFADSDDVSSIAEDHAHQVPTEESYSESHSADSDGSSKKVEGECQTLLQQENKDGPATIPSFVETPQSTTIECREVQTETMLPILTRVDASTATAQADQVYHESLQTHEAVQTMSISPTLHDQEIQTGLEGTATAYPVAISTECQTSPRIDTKRTSTITSIDFEPEPHYETQHQDLFNHAPPIRYDILSEFPEKTPYDVDLEILRNEKDQVQYYPSEFELPRQEIHFETQAPEIALDPSLEHVSSNPIHPYQDASIIEQEAPDWAELRRRLDKLTEEKEQIMREHKTKMGNDILDKPSHVGEQTWINDLRNAVDPHFSAKHTDSSEYQRSSLSQESRGSSTSKRFSYFSPVIDAIEQCEHDLDLSRFHRRPRIPSLSTDEASPFSGELPSRSSVASSLSQYPLPESRKALTPERETSSPISSYPLPSLQRTLSSQEGYSADQFKGRSASSFSDSMPEVHEWTVPSAYMTRRDENTSESLSQEALSKRSMTPSDRLDIEQGEKVVWDSVSLSEMHDDLTTAADGLGHFASYFGLDLPSRKDGATLSTAWDTPLSQMSQYSHDFRQSDHHLRNHDPSNGAESLSMRSLPISVPAPSVALSNQSLSFQEDLSVQESDAIIPHHGSVGWNERDRNEPILYAQPSFTIGSYVEAESNASSLSWGRPVPSLHFNVNVAYKKTEESDLSVYEIEDAPSIQQLFQSKKKSLAQNLVDRRQSPRDNSTNASSGRVGMSGTSISKHATTPRPSSPSNQAFLQRDPTSHRLLKSSPSRISSEEAREITMRNYKRLPGSDCCCP
eukprot:TRINITY_DN7755_c0_g1_i1.p1 TRINITY_DN7755_c0_g1~~TRINITY_DN7755_c0_g1_i1.p1  ORF type:complete len:1242 (+),score=255.66 TRINITY_DN7755_c0_g1_i1:126-3851(+)